MILYDVFTLPINHPLQTLKSNQAMTDALKGVTKAMASMNKKIQLPAIQKIMMDFEKESEMMDMKQEMVEDAIDDVMEADGEEIESDEIVQQVLDEIGISLEDKVSPTFSPEGAFQRTDG